MFNFFYKNINFKSLAICSTILGTEIIILSTGSHFIYNKIAKNEISKKNIDRIIKENRSTVNNHI